ncbi:hypothetical protein [Coraliomargarita parva]|uniref:hypothetical protein n=1 Tax=Coraliomargarita parva TaxID=3014050 RepID=UPI0022B4BB99|nr:hypothetical protein [Coraliomargarita parva]
MKAEFGLLGLIALLFLSACEKEGLTTTELQRVLGISESQFIIPGDLAEDEYLSLLWLHEGQTLKYEFFFNFPHKDAGNVTGYTWSNSQSADFLNFKLVLDPPLPNGTTGFLHKFEIPEGYHYGSVSGSPRIQEGDAFMTCLENGSTDYIQLVLKRVIKCSCGAMTNSPDRTTCSYCEQDLPSRKSR